MKWLSMLLFLASSLAAAGGPRLVYSRAFPGSEPAYLQVTLDSEGNAEYGEAPDDDNPLKFRLTPAETQEVFALAQKLDYFNRPLESSAKVAFMGKKTFRYEDGQRKGEATFNYSDDVAARALQDWFERMAESARRRIDLERAAKYDKLGVPKALLLLQADMEKHVAVGLEQYLPMLDRIAKNETYMHTARVRAAELAETIRNGGEPKGGAEAKPKQ